ncbi:MAG TPA: CsgE family curli-type amyloid fiber assembly protein [Castellaniella sp.]|uniref:CsgE family curli-type amyloid fiber assembly protein n=1 Tax=Castellaniella sp. TaxID=1955812 RepID=UPI002EEB3E4A
MRSIGLRLFKVSVCCVMVSSGTPSFGQQPTSPDGLDRGQINNEPLRGLMINRTMTVMGWNFYKSFAEVWQALYPDSQDNLSVVERPTAQYGSEIWINTMNQTVYHTFISPTRAREREESRNAAEVVHNNIDIINAQRKLALDVDLGPEEM